VGSFFSPEQREDLRRRGHEAGEMAFIRGRQSWAELTAAMDKERQQGTEPSHPRVRELTMQWQRLVEEMTGSNFETQRAMMNMMENANPEMASGRLINAELWAYVKRAYAEVFREPSNRDE
jgi:hypothetical protein